jgi:hypothetical protein
MVTATGDPRQRGGFLGETRLIAELQSDAVRAQIGDHAINMPSGDERPFGKSLLNAPLD